MNSDKSEVEYVQICKYLKQVKREVILEDDVEYRLLGVKWYGKGAFIREEKTGGEIKASKLYRVQSGDFIYNRLFAWKSSFSIIPKEYDGCLVSNEFPTFVYDSSQTNINFLLNYILLPQNIDQVNKLSKGVSSVSRNRFKEKLFLDMEIPDYPLEKQNEIDTYINKFSFSLNSLDTEITHQQSLLKKLHQTILHDAISGKLTEKWRKENPDVEPAKELFARIKAEKERLVKEKEIKKQKPLPPITEHEIPFELPEGWVWTRLGEILNKFLGGYSFKSPFFKKSGINQVLRLGNIRPDLIRFNENPVFVDDDLAKEAENVKLKPNDLLITMTGTRGKKDYCYTVLLNDMHFSDRVLFLNQRVGCFRLNNIICNKYFNYALKDNGLLKQIFSTATGSANQANIGAASLNSWIVPLPPQKETEIIVSKVEKLLTYCDELEQQVSKSQQYSELLMQTVLREAFGN